MVGRDGSETGLVTKKKGKKSTVGIGARLTTGIKRRATTTTTTTTTIKLFRPAICMYERNAHVKSIHFKFTLSWYN